ncbi:unnamed protein product [Sympodiomycopsis kandeliae]
MRADTLGGRPEQEGIPNLTLSMSRERRHHIAHKVDAALIAGILEDHPEKCTNEQRTLIAEMFEEIFGVPLKSVLKAAKSVTDGQGAFDEAHKKAIAKSNKGGKARLDVSGNLVVTFSAV